MDQHPDSLIKTENGVDPAEPTVFLGMPETAVLQNVRESWRFLKKRANIYLVVDASGSMRGKRIARAKEALLFFIDDVAGDRDQVALVTFSDKVKELQSLKPLDKESLERLIRNIITGGGSQPYQAVTDANNMLFDRRESGRINLIVVMTDELSSGVIEPIFREPDFPDLVYIIEFGAKNCHPGSPGCLPVRDHVRLTDFPRGQVETSEPSSLKKLFSLLNRFF